MPTTCTAPNARLRASITSCPSLPPGKISKPPWIAFGRSGRCRDRQHLLFARIPAKLERFAPHHLDDHVAEAKLPGGHTLGNPRQRRAVRVAQAALKGITQ